MQRAFFDVWPAGVWRPLAAGEWVVAPAAAAEAALAYGQLAGHLATVSTDAKWLSSRDAALYALGELSTVRLPAAPPPHRT